jgi:hypothetical protein
MADEQPQPKRRKQRSDLGVPRAPYGKRPNPTIHKKHAPRSDRGVARLKPYKLRSDRGKKRKPVDYNAILQAVPTEVIQAEIEKRTVPPPQAQAQAQAQV